MVLKLFFDISTSFRFSKDQCECTLHSEAPPWLYPQLISSWTTHRLDLFLFIPLSRSYLKCPVKTIALYYQSACPTYFLSTLQPTLLYSDSFLVTWVDVVQDIVFFKRWQLILFYFSQNFRTKHQRISYANDIFSSEITDVFLISWCEGRARC